MFEHSRLFGRHQVYTDGEQYIVLQSNRQKIYILSPETFIGFIHKSRPNILGGLQQESVGRHDEQQLICKQQQLICKQQFI